MPMNADLRPRRSVLYMPGSNEKALEKAKGIPADALILDLEDAVAPDAKPEARERVCAAAGGGGGVGRGGGGGRLRGARGGHRGHRPRPRGAPRRSRRERQGGPRRRGG